MWGSLIVPTDVDRNYVCWFKSGYKRVIMWIFSWMCSHEGLEEIEPPLCGLDMRIFLAKARSCGIFPLTSSMHHRAWRCIFYTHAFQMHFLKSLFYFVLPRTMFPKTRQCCVQGKVGFVINSFFLSSRTLDAWKQRGIWGGAWRSYLRDRSKNPVPRAFIFFLSAKRPLLSTLYGNKEEGNVSPYIITQGPVNRYPVDLPPVVFCKSAPYPSLLWFWWFFVAG